MPALDQVSGFDQLLDSLPIRLAVRGRSSRAKVAREDADQGYCESKKLYYHGVKWHLLGVKQDHQPPLPVSLCLTEASRHDLPVLKEQVLEPLPGALFGERGLPRPSDRAVARQAGHDAAARRTRKRKGRPCINWRRGLQVYRFSSPCLYTRQGQLLMGKGSFLKSQQGIISKES
jgi:hypothetical protein